MANIFAAQVQIETKSPSLIPRPFPIPCIVDQFSSFCWLGLFVGGVRVLWIYTAVSARVPASGWPAKDCEVSHSLDEGEARARETEEAVVTNNFFDFYVCYLILCSSTHSLFQFFLLWWCSVDVCLNWTITMENMTVWPTLMMMPLSLMVYYLPCTSSYNQ